jgi:hypothetical protein
VVAATVPLTMGHTIGAGRPGYIIQQEEEDLLFAYILCNNKKERKKEKKMGLAYSYYSAVIDCIPIRIQYRSFFFNQYFFLNIIKINRSL